MGTIQVPDLKWEWRVGPQTLLSLLQLIAIVVAVIGGFLKMQADLDSSSKTISELKSLVSTMQTAQINQAERVTRVETKVDLIFPALQRIESRQLREPSK